MYGTEVMLQLLLPLLLVWLIPGQREMRNTHYPTLKATKYSINFTHVRSTWQFSLLSITLDPLVLFSSFSLYRLIYPRLIRYQRKSTLPQSMTHIRKAHLNTPRHTVSYILLVNVTCHDNFSSEPSIRRVTLLACYCCCCCCCQHEPSQLHNHTEDTLFLFFVCNTSHFEPTPAVSTPE